MLNKISQQAVSGILAAAVVLGCVHGKDLARLSADQSDAKVHASDTQATKISGELHNHIDKQSLQSLLKVSTGDTANTHAIDNRSLRLLHSHKLISLTELRHRILGDHLFALALLTI
jgi:hypothetical protein